MKADTKNEMTYTQLVKKTGLMNMVRALAAYGESTLEAQAVSNHSAILKAGLSFKNASNNLESLGSVDERVRRDKQKGRLSAVLQSHAQLISLRNKQAELASRAEELNNNDEGLKMVDFVSMDLIGLDSFGAFGDLVESEMIYDTLSRHLHVSKEALMNSFKTLSKSIEPVSGPTNDWRATLVSSDPIEKVLELAAEKLLKMDLKGSSLKAAVEALEQDALFFWDKLSHRSAPKPVSFLVTSN